MRAPEACGRQDAVTRRPCGLSLHLQRCQCNGFLMLVPHRQGVASPAQERAGERTHSLYLGSPRLLGQKAPHHLERQCLVEGRRGSPWCEVQGSFARRASQREAPSQRKRAPLLLQASWAAGKSLHFVVSVHLRQGHRRLFDGWDGERFGVCLGFVGGLSSEPEGTEMRGREGRLEGRTHSSPLSFNQQTIRAALCSRERLSMTMCPQAGCWAPPLFVPTGSTASCSFRICPGQCGGVHACALALRTPTGCARETWHWSHLLTHPLVADMQTLPESPLDLNLGNQGRSPQCPHMRPRGRGPGGSSQDRRTSCVCKY